MIKIEAVLPLPEEIGEHKLPLTFYQQLVNEQHDIVERRARKVGRGYRNSYETVGNCKCAVRGKMVYINGTVSHIPETAKYLRLATAVDANIYFVFTEEGGILAQSNFKFKEVTE